jgi:hypothetical protein
MSKIFEYLKIGIKAIGKFVKYVYAPYMVMSLMSILYYALGFKLLGVGFLVFTILFLINEINLNNTKV